MAITERILGAAFKVHTAFGVGRFESTYGACVRYQFSKDGLSFRHQVRLPIIYEVLTYLKSSSYQLGLLINFNVPHLRDGIRRVIRDQ
jgi:hypothetical protein